jgi:polysaccharide pyruvyl transferase WcaK-like protein
MTDLALQAWTAWLIERAKADHIRRDHPAWRPGEPLRILFAGYNGARNTGSDVRVEEMLRQVRHVLGADRVDLSVLTQDFELTRGYFGDASQVKLADIFPPFLAREVPKHHGVIACEGSMFKSRFADALTTMMVGALGIAAARNGLSVGYGAEAGDMSDSLRTLVRRYCSSSLVITRNEESEKILRRLRVPTEPGTDTAWTFRPHADEHGRDALRREGWDGETPVLSICPINPFWWPVRASVPRAAARALTGAFREAHYRSVYFHRSGAEVTRAYTRYLDGVAGAVEAFRKEHRVFPVLVAMERLDADACRRVADRLGGTPVFESANRDMYELVSVLRQSRMMVSSRFHAIVTSMPALVPSLGITMDERIRNLMTDRGHADLLFEVDDPELEARVYDGLHQLWFDAEVFSDGIGRCVTRNLRRMAHMGRFLEEEVARRFPDFETRRGVVEWSDYLPPITPDLDRLLERYDAPAPEEACA